MRAHTKADLWSELVLRERGNRNVLYAMPLAELLFAYFYSMWSLQMLETVDLW